VKLVVQPTAIKKTDKFRVTKYDMLDRLMVEVLYAFVDPKDFERAEKSLGVSETILRQVLLEQAKKPKEPYVYVSDNRGIRPLFRIRGEHERTTSARVVGDIKAALHDATPGQVIEWDNTIWVCCLDIDFPNDAPSADQFHTFATTVKPAPQFYWHSRSGVGMHMVYYAANVFDADELAAIAGYNIQRRFPNCRVEFLHRTRAVPSGTQLTEQTQDSDPVGLRSLLTTFTEVDINAYLESNNWKVGQRLPHSDCPVNPSERAKANSNPVIINEDCVYCYVCAADGIRLGSPRPGRFPFAALSGKRVNTQISRCIENLVHWGHARHVMSGKVTSCILARKVYAALLKLQYGDDDRIQAVFCAGEPNGLVRYTGYWADNRGSIVDLPKGSSILRSLPHCQDRKANGILTTNPVNVEWLSQAVDQSCRGYYPVIPIYGIQITQFQALPEDKIYSIQTSRALINEQYESRRPCYVPTAERQDIEHSWKVLEGIYPGLNRAIIQALIAARGCIEHRNGLPPMFAITGVTGSGKTSHVEIAASIIGDSSFKVYLNRDRDRFMNEVTTAKAQSGFINLDEIYKFATQAGMTATEGMESLLSFTETSMVYRIHIGGIPFGHLPVFVFTDASMPDEVKQHEQIGRRVFHAHLLSQVSWEKTLAASGIGETQYLRVNGSDEVIASCNAILSQVIDDFFLTPATDFEDVCDILGFKKLQHSEVNDDRTFLMQELYNAVCKAPNITDPNDKRRFTPPGFKICIMIDSDPIYRAFAQCQTDKERGGIDIRMFAENDIQQKLGLKTPCKLEVRKHGSKFAIRFVSSTDPKLVNEGLR